MSEPLASPWRYGSSMGFGDAPPSYRGSYLDDSGGMWWPIGEYHMSNPSLADHLQAFFQFHARLAVQQFTSKALPEVLQAAVSAGTAYELGLKAHLCRVAPSLLAAQGDRDSLLMLAGKGHLINARGTDFKSISVRDASSAARHLTPTLPLPQSSLSMKVRNAASHMALVESRELRLAVIELVRLADAILTADSLDRDRFWGEDALDVVNALVDQATSAIKQRFIAKMAAARQRIATMTAGLSEEQKRTILLSLSGRPVGSGDYNRPWECPVCLQQGTLICWLDDTDIELEVDGETFSTVRQIAYPFNFMCPVCDLDLDEDEVDLVEAFPPSIHVYEEVDDNWEPDEDLLRDR